MDAKRYTVTVFSAAPGTWVNEVGYDGADHFSRSITGHVFFETDDGFHKKSWGFAPVEHGDVHGPGEPKEKDADEYIDPMYERTMEISRDQFDKLNEFGATPERFGFDLTYKDIRNNCVDYTWAALNHAGIQRTHGHIGHLEPHGVDGKYSYLPILTPNDFRTIRDPVPGSDLNKEVSRELPERDWKQAPFGTFDRPLSAVSDDPFERLYAAAVTDDEKAFDKVGQEYLQSQEGQAFLEAGQEANRQRELAEQQAQAQVQQGPVMSMTM
jgi:hypothetical protein